MKSAHEGCAAVSYWSYPLRDASLAYMRSRLCIRILAAAHRLGEWGTRLLALSTATTDLLTRTRPLRCKRRTRGSCASINSLSRNFCTRHACHLQLEGIVQNILGQNSFDWLTLSRKMPTYQTVCCACCRAQNSSAAATTADVQC